MDKIRIILSVFVIYLMVGLVLAIAPDKIDLRGSILPSDGVIIEFDGHSLSVENNILELVARDNQEKIDSLSDFNPYKYLFSLFFILEEDIDSESIKNWLEINKEHEDVINRIERKLKNYGIYNSNINPSGELIVIREYKNVFNGISVDIDEDAIAILKTVEGVKNVYPNNFVSIATMDTIPLLKADQVWKKDKDGNDCLVSGNQCINGSGITIGIIDTGVDYTHEDLGGCFGDGCKVVGGYDYYNDDNDPIDDHFHGTHVAATAAGNGVLKGVAPGANIYAYKVLSAGGGGNWDDIISAIDNSIDPNEDGDFSDHLDVISLSLGGFGNPDDPVSTAIDNAVDSGVVAVISAGNSGPNKGSIGSPGTARNAITVGATFKIDYQDFELECTPGDFTSCGFCDETGFVTCNYWGDSNPNVDDITSFSSRGPVIWEGEIINKPEVVAPGALICAARYNNVFPPGQHPLYHPCLDDQHLQVAGTSMSAPHVSGAVALILQVHPDWIPIDVKNVLMDTAVDIGEDIDTQGAGRIDIKAAVETVTPPPTPPIAILKTSGLVSGVIDIYGTARTYKPEDFNSYSLYYSVASDPDNWFLITTENSPVFKDILYSGFDTSVLEPGDNFIRLVVSDNNGSEKEVIKDLLRPNYNNAAIICSNSPCIADESLIGSRDSISIKTEPNQPNTIISSCTDGQAGSYLNDESLESIIITSLDNNKFNPGDKVRVDVKVFCFSSGDKMKIVYMNDGRDIEVIDSQICSVSRDFDNFIFEFNLDDIEGYHVVRGIFQYYGDSESTCSSNLFDDNDDIVLNVEDTSCVDYDGFNLVESSYVEFDGVTFDDVCVSQNQVKEYFCEYNIFRREKVVKDSVKKCLSSCNNGACLNQLADSEYCADNDIRNDLTFKGELVIGGQVYNDKCEEDGKSVREYYCTKDNVRNFVKRCPFGLQCINGACGVEGSGDSSDGASS